MYAILVMNFIIGYLFGLLLYLNTPDNYSLTSNNLYDKDLDCHQKRFLLVRDEVNHERDNAELYAPAKFDVIRIKLERNKELKNITNKIGVSLLNNQDLLLTDPSAYKARILSKRVRILCWIMTYPKVLKDRAKAAKETWGRHCDILLFMSSSENKEFPTVGLNVPEGYFLIWLKTKAAWNYIFENYIDAADWFIKVDDDSYVIVENLRRFLSTFDTEKEHFFGRHFTADEFNSGGAGYVFSRKTLREFVQISKDTSVCANLSRAEDVELAKCLAAGNISPSYSRDYDERQKFHPFSPGDELLKNLPAWVGNTDRWKLKGKFECCSKHSISFHYISPDKQYEMEFLVYHLKVWGVKKDYEYLN